MAGRFNFDTFDAAAQRDFLVAQPMGSLFRHMTDAEVLRHVLLHGHSVSEVNVHANVIYVRLPHFEGGVAEMRGLLDYVLVREGREFRLDGISTFGEEQPELLGGTSIQHGLELQFRAGA